jgi:hypothetical protein
MALEGLYLPVNKPWAEKLRSELLSFPAGKYDDHVDALGLVGQLLDQIVPGQAPRPVTPVQRDRYRRKWSDEDDQYVNWKSV